MDHMITAVRCRPMTDSEIKSGLQHVVEIKSDSKQVVVSGERVFTLNHVYAETATQQDIYNELVQPVVRKVMDGYNGCVMAYGQTGSGKTYTMGTEAKPASPGIIQNALEEVFKLSNDTANVIHVSFLEVYKEEVLDLLSSNKKKMPVVDFKPVGLTMIKLDDVRSALDVIVRGLRNRHVGATNANVHSSRSHAIFTIHFTKMFEDHQLTSKLYLVDLAGSESASEEYGDTRREGLMINKGLLQLGNVMSALSSAGQEHVPYRNSVLTAILKDCLSFKNYVVVIACVSPLNVDSTTTTSSLQFATRVGSVKCNPEAGLVISKVPLTTPFKIPLKKKQNITIAGTPGIRCKASRPALRPLNKTFDSPRTPQVAGKRQYWPTSTPAQTVTKPLFSEPTPILKENSSQSRKRRSSSEWNTLDISSSTDIDSTVAQVKSQVKDANKTGLIPNSENESWLRSIITDVIREELRSHTFLGRSEVNNGLSSPKLPRRSTRLSKSMIFETDSQTTIVSSSPICDGSPNLTRNETIIERAVIKANQHLPNSPEAKKGVQSMRRSVRLSLKHARLSEAFEEIGNKSMSTKSSKLVKTTVSVRRSTRLSVAPRPVYYPETNFQPSTCSVMQCSASDCSKVSQKSKKTVRRSARLSSLPSIKPEHAQEHLNNVVLDVLRQGNLKKLQSLPTVGPKTAVIISNHRLLHGPIESLRDLESIRGLSANFAKRFFWANNIILEDDSGRQ